MATMTRLSRDHLRFLDENPFVGVVTTLRPDGSPHSTVVWVDVEDGVVAFNTEEGRAKPRYIEGDPRVSLLVIDPADAHRWVALSGPVEVTTEGAREQIDKLAKKYTGADTFASHNPDKERLKVRIHPERVDSAGFDN
jgi:PPOX class probable F420-dependent enzyme